MSSRQRRAGQGQKESIKPLANRWHHDLYAQCFFPRGLPYRTHSLRKEDGLLLRPSPICLPRPRRRQAEPPGCSPFVWQPGGDSRGMGAPILDVSAEFHILSIQACHVTLSHFPPPYLREAALGSQIKRKNIGFLFAKFIVHMVK